MGKIFFTENQLGSKNSGGPNLKRRRRNIEVNPGFPGTFFPISFMDSNETHEIPGTEQRELLREPRNQAKFSGSLGARKIKLTCSSESAKDRPGLVC